MLRTAISWHRTFINGIPSKYKKQVKGKEASSCSSQVSDRHVIWESSREM